jgi:calcineurin-like phosphoesterase family protein
MKTFVTSNQQFGRPGAIKSYKRPFEDVQEMNQELFESWNSVVSPEDTVYVLGNFAWDPETAEYFLRNLNGTIINIEGEFDSAIEELEETATALNIDFFNGLLEVFSEENAVLSYWPLLEWPRKSKGAYSIIGFPNKKYGSNHKTKTVNCCCDFWEFKPVELSKIIELFNEVE